MGHPNEGKSSFISTMIEDDKIKIKPNPKTKPCRVFSLLIDGREAIRFVDTPGFRNPSETLDWMKKYQGPDHQALNTFCTAHRSERTFQHECELFQPILRGAGLIYVADGSRQLYATDLEEMEILRRTGLPRLAILNCKQPEYDYLSVWEEACLKHFNLIRVFNVHHATSIQRIDLLLRLGVMIPQWKLPLEKVVAALKQNWKTRNECAALIICDFLEDCIRLVVKEDIAGGLNPENVQKEIQDQFRKKVGEIEVTTQRKMKCLFRHHLFNLDLPEYAFDPVDLFSYQSQLQLPLGLMSLPLTAAIRTAWSTAGVMIDMAVVKPQFLYALLNRILIYYAYLINWPHSRRDRPKFLDKGGFGKKVQKDFSVRWDYREKRVFDSFVKAIQTNNSKRKKQSRKTVFELLKEVLFDISNGEV